MIEENLPDARQPTNIGLHTELDEMLVHSPWPKPVSHYEPYFDYATFARPWNYHLDHTADTSDWFSSQFFAALRETDLACSPLFQTWNNTGYEPTTLDIMGALDRGHDMLPPSVTVDEGAISLQTGDDLLQSSQVRPRPNERPESLPGRASRVASPPNESSHEDRLPFAWDPRSKPIARANPIVLPMNDPIFASINRAVEISQTTLSRVSAFLRPANPVNGEDIFTMPELPLVNVFISLFFGKFLPQVPVLHKPTMKIEAFPPALLSIIIVIGSCYSRLRHTRRFGIIVFDRTRQNLLALIEEDNSLMRDPLSIYAAALVCYMGLWCGNKRAFELSEALRAVVVTYIRRLPNDHNQQVQPFHEMRHTTTRGHTNSVPHLARSNPLQSQWSGWATQESHKRLRWFIYMIDSQFPAILGMNGMMTTADIRKWECPCDEEFWTVATARSWKNKLGSASEPSCPIFGSLTALLLLAPEQPVGNESVALLPSVNTWSANLLMTVAMSEVFHFQETLVVIRTYEEPECSQSTISSSSSHMSCHVAHLLGMLELWKHSYVLPHQTRRPDTTSSHLKHCSMIMYHLARLYLVFPISDIQDSLGRSGPADAEAARTKLSAWIHQCPEQAARAVEDAATCISLIMCNEGESDPYDVIGLFLCHVVVWSFAHAASAHQKGFILRQLQDKPGVSPAVLEVIQAGFAHDDSTDDSEVDAPQLVFRHAIQSLVQLGTWGASSNLALLLHLHPGAAR
ncbi:DNA binding [Ascochyta rabiei]|uniref:DNA binding n=2 Tax=Didymella rabiei TaxID=5454 RepID=A0A163LNR5_DIDRA|nr:DNA binding [Ascochyta rabiei]